MSAWPEGLQSTLERVTADFGISRIPDRARLAQARQTGFVWTSQPGIVCLAANRQYLAQARANPDVAVVITSEEVASDPAAAQDACLVLCKRPDELYLFLHVAQVVDRSGAEQRIDPSAEVDPSAILRGAVTIEAGAYVGPRVVVSGPVVIGRNAYIEAGAIIGCDGLYAKDIAGSRRHIPHFGGVSIGDEAYVHAGAVIVRSAILGEATLIGRQAHIGVLANVGHDADVGPRATISSNVVIAGRARVGEGAWIGASVTISNAVLVGENAKVRIGATAVRDVPAGADVSSDTFAISHAKAMRSYTRKLHDENR